MILFTVALLLLLVKGRPIAFDPNDFPCFCDELGYVQYRPRPIGRLAPK